MNKYLDQIGTLTDEQKALLVNQLKSKLIGREIPKTENHTLSFPQKRLWFLSQLDPESSAYNIPSAFLLLGELDIDVLQTCFKEVANRHETLRTSIVEDIDGEPIRKITSESSVMMEFLDLRELPKDVQRQERNRIVNEEIQKPFNLKNDSSLWRVVLLQLNDDEHYLVVTMHHIIFDGWSVTVLLQELSELYGAFINNTPSKLMNLTTQYSDYVSWQQKHLTDELFQEQLTYWKTALEGSPPVLELPTTYLRPAIQTFKGSSYVFELSKATSDNLKKLCNSEESTAFMAMLTVFYTLLYRYTGQDDIIVGVPISGRNRNEFQKLIGVFVNTLPLRVRLSRNVSFKNLLKQVKEASLEAFSHQDVPFETIVQNVAPERSSSLNPLFQVLFTYQNAVPNYRLNNVLMNYQPIDGGTAKFDLSLDILDGGDIYPQKCILEYNTDLFDSTFIYKMAEHFQILLEKILSEPDKPIGEINYLTTEELNQLKLWNGNIIDFPKDENVCTWFEKQVERNPDAIAIVFKYDSMTYRELNVKANQLASLILKQKEVEDSIIGICLPKSMDLVISVLGVLKTGLAYLPMDSSYPSDRLHYMLKDSKVATIITNKVLNSSLLAESSLNTIVVDDTQIKEKLNQESSTNKPIKITPDSLAYIIYTSGSTGLPKGTMVSHNNLVHTFNGWEHEYQLMNNTSAHLQMASFSFDVCVGDIVRALCSGSKLVLCPEDVLLDPEQLYQLLFHEKIDCAEFVPAIIRSLLQYLEDSQQKLDFMKLVIVGSDSWKIEEYQKLCNYCGAQTRVINSYGLTEATIDSSYFECANNQLQSNDSLPIGKPFPNTQLLILDEYRQVVPVGIPGELYISGDGVAQGYLYKKELTSERFILLPDESGTMKRAYKTGDLAKYLPDGNIELIGRSDFQIKIRGYRIELNEIENNILQYPGITQSIVVVRTGNSELQSLVAYIICQKNSAVSIRDLKSYLNTKLPDYMVPSYIVLLDAFPLTNNGKIDRKQLPEPDITEWNMLNEYTPARTLTEEILVDIWKEVFGVSRISVNDDFFQIGGYSLLAMKITAQVRKIFKIEFSLQTLFNFTTISRLAIEIDNLKGKNQEYFDDKQLLPVIIPNLQDRYEPFPLTDIQQAYWIGRNDVYELGNVATHSYDEYEAQYLDINKFEEAWNYLIKRHDMLRTVITPDGKQQVYRKVPYYPLTITDLRGKNPDEVESAVKATRVELSHQVLDIYKWPVFDIRITLLEDQKSLIHFSSDALMWDVWSFVILMRELVTIYQGKENELAPLEISFRDYVMAIEEFKKTDKYNNALDYWKKRVDSLPMAPELPLSKSPKELRNPQFVRLHESLDFQSWKRLKSKAMKTGITTTGILLAAFTEVLRYWSNSPDFSLNLTFLNRNAAHPQVNDIVGEFTSVNLLAVSNSNECSFIERARKIQADLWSDLENHYISGVQVLREMTTKKGGAFEAKMPVVFTSALVVPIPEEKDVPFPIKPVNVNGVTQTSQVWLDCGVWDDRNGLYCNWDVVEEIYPPGFIRSMFSTFWSLVTRLANEEEIWNQQVIPLIPLEQLELRNDIILNENIESADLLHSLFNQKAKSQPDSPAIISRHKTMTYDEVYKWSNKIGRFLKYKGTQPNQLIAIFMEKGWEQVVSVLGILQSGSAYLPIDPALPNERILYLLRSTGVKIILTQSGMKSQIKLPEEISIYEVNEQFLSDWSDEPLPFVQSPDDLAYVIFTSGSTGDPKGVMITHSGAVNTIIDINSKFNVTEKDRVIALSALHFDLSVYDIFGSLAAGASIVIPDADEGLNPKHLEWLLSTEKVTVWNSVPALMEMFMNHLSQKNGYADNLRLVMLSGDWIAVSLPELIRSYSSTELIISLGGATEASIWSIFYPIENLQASSKSVPYGKALSKQKMLVLNESLEPCPDWVTGQIYIGGIGLSTGYWKDQIRTNESFIYHPKTKERLYRTGDLGRYLPDGNIEFIGREDFQIKINGYRIEIGEIEYMLLQHPAIKDVVVTVADEGTTKRLMAFYIQAHGETVESRNLRTFLIQKLPEYMIPKNYIKVDKFPLTSNMKVDRQLLIRNVDVESLTINCYEKPRTVVEEKIAEIWSSLLALDEIGVHDSFYELGGDSLQSMKMIEEIRDTYQINFPLRALLQISTIEEMATYIEEQLEIENNSVKARLSEGNVKNESVNSH
ncbi:amino acid adenylation domain-containing protein [Lysinibacillus sp. NPDC086135]|uniref:amino acid adenylation domain-containing protein n=1 Tax=Lysinibacillus sp. NPDC086135 TaxID=3364130 RepID=UPI00381998F1